MIKNMLKSLGHEIVGEAEDVPQALDFFKSLSPEAVTLDMVLPSGSGLDILRAIRAQNATTRVIVVTASGQDGIDRQVMELGANAVMHKPFTPDEFKSTIHKTLA